ncbi:MAG TPA: hypothetical protein VI584_08370 [Nitrospiria bacterium]|nr:hypothetical protein [Nitrospiria bacterium]
MSDILIRNVSEKTLKRLKAMANRHNRSLQQELKEVLENLAKNPVADVSKKASEIRIRLKRKGIEFSDSAKLQREDRSR